MPVKQDDQDSYRALEASCLEELDRNQWEVADLTLFERELDFANSRLLLFDGERPLAQAELVLIGSRGEHSSSWLWGWANRSRDDEQRATSAALRDLATETGNEEFRNEQLADIPERRAWGLAAVAARKLGARGIWDAISLRAHPQRFQPSEW